MARTGKPKDRGDAVLVVGLGRFGSSIAATLDELGREVDSTLNRAARALVVDQRMPRAASGMMVR